MATIEETQELVEGLTRFVVIPSKSHFYFCGDDSNLDPSKNVAIWVDPAKVALHFTKSKDPFPVWYWEHTLCEIDKRYFYDGMEDWSLQFVEVTSSGTFIKTLIGVTKARFQPHVGDLVETEGELGTFKVVSVKWDLSLTLPTVLVVASVVKVDE